MFKRISIILLILFTLLGFTIGANAVAAGLFVEKDAANTYIDYVDADGTSIMLIDDTTGVTIAALIAGNTYTSMVITDTTDATSITTGSITTKGGASIADQLWLGDDIDMTTNTTGIYDITLKTNQADALSIVDDAPGDLILFCTTTGSQLITITPALTVTGIIQSNGGILVGADDAGFDVTFFGENSGSDFAWAEAGDTDGSLTLGTTGGTKGVDFMVYGEASGTYLHWDRSVDDLLLGGAVTRIILSGTVDTSLTDASIVTSGGIACTKQLWLGDDIDMSTSTTGVYDITLRDSVADALSIVAGAELMRFKTDTDQIIFTPEIVLTDDIDMQTSTTGVYDITLKDAQADGLSIVAGTTDMIVFTTTTDAIAIIPPVTITGALNANGGIDITAATTGININGAGTNAIVITQTGSTSTIGSCIAIGTSATPITTATSATSAVRVYSDFSNTTDLNYHVGAWFSSRYTADGDAAASVYTLRGHAEVEGTLTAASGSQYIEGVHGRVIVTGAIVNSAAMVMGMKAEVLDGSASTTTVSHMACLWADWQNTDTVTGETECLYLTDNAAATTVDQCMFIYGDFSYFIKFDDACTTFVDATATAGDQCVGHIKIRYKDADAYINVFSDNS